MQHEGSLAAVWLYMGIGLFFVSIVCYWVAARFKKENTSRLNKQQKAELKKKNGTMRILGHSLLGVSIILSLVYLFQISNRSYDLESLNFNVPIDVTTDEYYGAEHSDDPVQYEMDIPTSGTHSPHDLKIGFYSEKPPTEKLVHNLEHGDIIIHYRAGLDEKTMEIIEYLTHFRKGGAGVLAVPDDAVPTDKEVILTAWTKTMELEVFDEQKAGQFIYTYINQGPEQIPAQIRRGGGTM